MEAIKVAEFLAENTLVDIVPTTRLAAIALISVQRS